MCTNLHVHLQSECSKISANCLNTVRHSEVQHKKIYSDFYGGDCNMNIFCKAGLKTGKKLGFYLSVKVTSLLTLQMLSNSRSRNLF